MNHVKFISYSDIHYDMLGAKCVTVQDSEEVERAIFKRAKEGKFDFTLFCGDRFLAREPKDEVKVAADKVIYDCVHNGNIPHLVLVGNHDQTTLTRKHHTSESLKFFNNVVIMDESKTYEAVPDVFIHALPAEYELDFKNYNLGKRDKLNIFTFHDTVKGSWLDDEGKMSINSGLSLDDLDREDLDLILAGDIHVRQQFKLSKTGGGYLGSVTQRTRADSNIPRGWTEITATRKNTKSPWVFDIKFVPTKNLFTRISFGVDKNTEFADLVFDEKDVVNQFVEVKLVGNKSNVDRVADDPGWKKFHKTLKPRRVEVLRSYETEQSNVVVDLSTSTGVLDDLSLYLDSKFASLGNLKADKVADVVRRLKRQEGPIQ